MLTKGSRKEGAKAPLEFNDWEIVLIAGVGNVERPMLAHPAGLVARSRLISTRAQVWVWDQNEPAKPNWPLRGAAALVIDPTNPGGALDDRVEDRLYVRGRAADDTEHLGRCRLMLQSLAQFRIALLDLLNRRTFSMAMTA